MDELRNRNRALVRRQTVARQEPDYRPVHAHLPHLRLGGEAGFEPDDVLAAGKRAAAELVLNCVAVFEGETGKLVRQLGDRRGTSSRVFDTLRERRYRFSREL